MNWNRLTRIAATMASAASLASLCFSQADPTQKRVDLFLRDADLHSAIQALTLQTGLQFVVQSGDSEFKKIDLNLSQKTAEEAIKYMCEAAGAHFVRDTNGVFKIYAGKAEKIEAPVKPVDNTIIAPIIVKRVRVMKGDPDMILSMLTKAVAYDSDNGMRQINLYTKERLDSYSPQIPAPQIVNSAPVTFPRVSQSGASEDSGNSITLPGENANQVGGGGPGAGGGGQTGGQNGGGSVTGLQPGQGSLVPQGIQKVIYDPTDNSFIVQGTEDGIRELERLIEQFDQQPRQVVIKVEFVSSTTTSSNALGIDWLYSRGTVFAGVRPGEFARSGDPVFFNYATGNISSRLRTLMNNGWGRTVSAPLVRTLNNQPAVVAQQVNTYIFIPTIINGAGGTQTVFTPVSIPITTVLSVRPRINNNNTITMTLAPQIQQLTGFSVGPDGTQVPNITSQSLALATIVKNGETIALAGFTAKRDDAAVKRIPVLSELPIVGQLFRSRNSSKDSAELVIFVTPHIVEEDELGLQP